MKNHICELAVKSLACVMLAASLTACGGAKENEPETGNGSNAAAYEEIPGESGETGSTSIQTEFPTEYHDTVNGVVFEAVVEVPEQADFGNLTVDTATRQYPDMDKAMQTFGQGKNISEERSEQRTDENGNAFTEYSGKFDDGSLLYIDNNLTYGTHDFEKILSAFRTGKRWDDYNADKYLGGQEFSFGTKEEMLEKTKEMVAAAGYDLQEMEHVCYSLDADTMKKEEISYDKAGNVVNGKYQWDASDNSYYFFICQSYGGIPVYFGNEMFPEDDEISMPIQAVYSESGLMRLDVTNLYHFTKGTEKVTLKDFNAVAESVAAKYGDVLADVDYVVERAKLYEMPMLKASGGYEVKPVWLFEIKESGIDSEMGTNFENMLYTFIDAQTGEEVVL